MCGFTYFAFHRRMQKLHTLNGFALEQNIRSCTLLFTKNTFLYQFGCKKNRNHFFLFTFTDFLEYEFISDKPGQCFLESTSRDQKAFRLKSKNDNYNYDTKKSYLIHLNAMYNFGNNQAPIFSLGVYPNICTRVCLHKPNKGFQA